MDGIGNLPTFYIDRRQNNDGIWIVECLDRAAFLDKRITGLVPSDGKYLSSAIADLAESACGFSSVALPAGMPTYIAQEKIDGKTYQAVLQEISEAFCGFFCSHYTNALEFVPYDQTQSGEELFDYSKIHTSGDFKYNSVNVSDGTKTQMYGSYTPTLEINNDFANPANSALYSGIIGSGGTFSGWSIEKAVSVRAELPLIGGTLTMSGTNYRVTRASCYVAGGSLLISAGGDIPQYGEINRRGLLQQRLDNAVSTDKTYGAIKPTSDKDLGFCAVPNKPLNGGT